MSHITPMELEVWDPMDLEAGAQELDPGAKIVNKQTYNWYGRRVGDFPLPEGMTEDQLGKCDLALTFSSGATARGYEVGLLKQRNGSYKLVWDFYDWKLMNLLGGQNAGLLKQAYTKHRILKNAEKMRRKAQVKKLENGTLEITLTRR